MRRRVDGHRRAGSVLAAVVIAAMLLAGCSTASRSASTAPTEPPPPAVPHPFGVLSCTPRYGVRFCPGGGSRRVPSFDGVPLDADVTLPATGRGPFPLIVLLHGLGASKTEFEVDHPDTSPGAENNVALASNGWAVLNYTARGFGGSCGTPASRSGQPSCARGWIQLADQRYEVRDTQYLAGELVDEGLVQPKIAVAGLSYGGGQSLELAVLKDRVRLTDGALVPWVSPVHHVPMSVGAVFAQWAWDDLADALVPNGHLSAMGTTPASADISPMGVPKLSWDRLLYGVTAEGYLSPPGVDPRSDLTTWEHAITAGGPETATDAYALRELQTYKSAIGIPLPPGGPAPTAILNGWNDTLFPASEALHYAARIRAAHDTTPLLLLFADVGHGWATNQPAVTAADTARGIAFVDAVMRRHATTDTGVVVSPTSCTGPETAATAGASLAALQHGVLTLTGSDNQVVTSAGGSATTAAQLNPAYAGKSFCDTLPPASAPGTATYQLAVGAQPRTLLGSAVVTATLHVVGNYPELVGRLWDVAPDGSRQLVSINVYRPSVNQAAGTPTTASATTTMSFALTPNDYTFAAGHTIELQLVGSTAPLFEASGGTFQVTVSGARVTVPVS
ncbi:MAG: CocE/NonD family hydrolase [Acidimicrobiales bacterium]